jgi:hypothetical protein
MTKTPAPLRQEHHEMLQFVTRLAREGGATGEAAQRLQRVMETHFHKEEAFAAPPLGLLRRLAAGDINPGMADNLVHTEWLSRNIGVLLAEHRMIAAALEDVLRAAAPGQAELITFAETLLNHARIEEEVLYPAAIVAGEYLKLRLAERAAITAL